MTVGKFDTEEYMRKQEELSRLVTVDDTHIVFHIPGNHVDAEYDIALNTCTNAEQIIGWIIHLTEKQWVDKQILRRFIKIATHHAGVKIEI